MNATTPAEGPDYLASARATLDLIGASDDVHLEFRNVGGPVSTLAGTTLVALLVLATRRGRR